MNADIALSLCRLFAHHNIKGQRDKLMRIFPVTLTPDKIKLPLIKDWYELASADPAQHAKWQQDLGQRITFWGLPTGSANGIIGVDFDIKNGKNGIEAAKAKGLIFPPTTSQRTMSGGLHLIYKAPANVTFKNTASKYADGVDTRGERGYLIYYGFDQTPIADCPQWLIDAEKAEAYERKGGDYLIQPGLAMQMLNEICADISYAPPGEANNILNLKAFEAAQQLIGTGSLSKQFVYDELFKAAKLRGKSDSEAKATIESGFAGGLRVPAKDICPFEPTPVVNMKATFGWTPQLPTRDMFFDKTHLKRKQNFKDWSSHDITLFVADGGTGKTTLLLNEAVCMALGRPFLGHECLQPGGKTLFIAGEDAAEKIYAITGNIMEDMQLTNEEIDIVVKSVLVKKESNMRVITHDRNGYLTANHNALNQVLEAVKFYDPRMIVLDPISMFWASEGENNDNSRAVAMWAGELRDRSNAQITLVNHIGKNSSQIKDLTQFAGLGGTALPSHARIVRTAIRLSPDEYVEKTGKSLEGMQYGLIMQTSKFSDGSPILGVPRVLTRTGFVFEETTTIKPLKEEKDDRAASDIVFEAILNLQRQQRYLTEDGLRALTGLSKDKIRGVISLSITSPINGLSIKSIPNPDITQKNNVLVVVDDSGTEIK